MSSDALGNPIIEGQWYGHSTRLSGFVEIVTGKAELVKDGNITLSEVIRGRASFSEPIHKVDAKRKVVTLVANSVFPISNPIGWING